jgi:hypothetical protein
LTKRRSSKSASPISISTGAVIERTSGAIENNCCGSGALGFWKWP